MATKIEEIRQEIKELEGRLDPYYEMSDDHSVWLKNHELKQRIRHLNRKLNTLKNELPKSNNS
jgi:polyhydroxyalkanoate synthesis regulator phasin